MLILSIDTSFAVCRVGLWKDGQILGEIAENNKKSHSVKLMPLVEEILQNSGCCVKDVDVFASVNGPGSYTGLRIGVTTCKLLGYSTEKPVVTVNTLDYLARSLTDISDDSIVCSCIDARNARVFFGIYFVTRNDNCYNFKQLCQYDADSVEIVTEKIIKFANEYNVNCVYLTGDGFFPNKEHFVSALGDKIKYPDEKEIMGTSKAACDIAYEKFCSEKDVNVFKSENAEVFYLRMPHITIKTTSAD